MNDKEALENLRQGLKGRGDGLTYLHAKYNNQITGFLRRRCSLSPEELEDVLQDSWFKFARSVQKGQYREEASVYTYLAKIAIRECLRTVGKRSPMPEIDDPDSLPDTTYLERQLCYQLCMAKALDQFIQDHPQSNCLDALTLQVNGRSILEITEKMGKPSPAATREFLSQCRKKLKSYLEPCDKDCGQLNGEQ